jgi:hypothetical protein
MAEMTDEVRGLLHERHADGMAHPCKLNSRVWRGTD